MARRTCLCQTARSAARSTCCPGRRCPRGPLRGRGPWWSACRMPAWSSQPAGSARGAAALCTCAHDVAVDEAAPAACLDRLPQRLRTGRVSRRAACWLRPRAAAHRLVVCLLDVLDDGRHDPWGAHPAVLAESAVSVPAPAASEELAACPGSILQPHCIELRQALPPWSREAEPSCPAGRRPRQLPSIPVRRAGAACVARWAQAEAGAGASTCLQSAPQCDCSPVLPALGPILRFCRALPGCRAGTACSQVGHLGTNAQRSQMVH